MTLLSKIDDGGNLIEILLLTLLILNCATQSLHTALKSTQRMTTLEMRNMRLEQSEMSSSEGVERGSQKAREEISRKNSDNLQGRVALALDALAPDDLFWIETIFGMRAEQDTDPRIPISLAFRSEKTKRILRKLRNLREGG